MEPSEFVRRWSELMATTGDAARMPLVKLASAEVPVSQKTLRFLTEAGLPNDMNFIELDLTKNLRRVGDVYGCYGKPGDWPPDDYARLNRYLYLGFDGGGNPICLDSTDEEKVVFLDHERFRAPNLTGQFINSGVAEFAECVLAYQEMLETYWQEEGAGAELYYGCVSERLVQEAVSKMRRADPQAVTEDSYWPGILEDI